MSLLRDTIHALARSGVGPRVSGRPPSGNGASSFHVWWDTNEPLAQVSAVLEVVEPPTVARLYFWALQVSFWSEARHEGGGHTGLQWNQRHAESTAVNWGGYYQAGGILPGSDSPLPSSPSDSNTRDFPWVPGARYRFTIGPRLVGEGDESLWPARIEGLDTGEKVEIRRLTCPGDHLRGPVVWSEIFADCDHPSVAVRWSELTGVTTGGERVAITKARVSYQSDQDGGCANTTVLVDGSGIVQRSNSERTTRHNSTLAWDER